MTAENGQGSKSDGRKKYCRGTISSRLSGFVAPQTDRQVFNRVSTRMPKRDESRH